MNRIAFFLVSLLLTLPAQAKSPGFQANFLGGVDFAGKNSSRGSARFVTSQLGTKSKFLRFHGGFTLLVGTGFLGGEGALGLSIYPLSSFVSERARVHPFLIGQGLAGVSRSNSDNKQDTGYSYGAGLDWELWRRAGFNISAQRVVTTETSMRYGIGFFWFRNPE